MDSFGKYNLVLLAELAALDAPWPQSSALNVMRANLNDARSCGELDYPPPGHIRLRMNGVWKATCRNYPLYVHHTRRLRFLKTGNSQRRVQACVLFDHHDLRDFTQQWLM